MRRMSCGQWGLLLTLVGFAALVFVAVGWYLGTDTVPLFDAGTWHVVDDKGAQILWQKDTSCLSDNEAGSLAVVENQVVFHQYCLPGIAVLKALDLTSGAQLWWAKSTSSSQILAVDDGVINLEDKTTLVKYGLAGNEVWRVGDFVAQSIERVVFQNDRVYVLQGSVTDVLSSQTGQRLDQVGDTPLFTEEAMSEPLRDIIAEQTNISTFVMDGHLYLYTSANSLQIYNTRTNALITTIPLERSGGYTGDVHLSGAANVLIIAYPVTHEIIALHIKPA